MHTVAPSTASATVASRLASLPAWCEDSVTVRRSPATTGPGRPVPHRPGVSRTWRRIPHGTARNAAPTTRRAGRRALSATKPDRRDAARPVDLTRPLVRGTAPPAAHTTHRTASPAWSATPPGRPLPVPTVARRPRSERPALPQPTRAEQDERTGQHRQGHRAHVTHPAQGDPSDRPPPRTRPAPRGRPQPHRPARPDERQRRPPVQAAHARPAPEPPRLPLAPHPHTRTPRPDHQPCSSLPQPPRSRRRPTHPRAPRHTQPHHAPPPAHAPA